MQGKIGHSKRSWIGEKQLIIVVQKNRLEAQCVPTQIQALTLVTCVQALLSGCVGGFDGLSARLFQCGSDKDACRVQG